MRGDGVDRARLRMKRRRGRADGVRGGQVGSHELWGGLGEGGCELARH